jgi:LCP family protein required for cell wall assembly
MGRGAAVNGNGDARAVFPPGVLTPVRTYRQPPPARRTGLQILWRFMFWAFAAVVSVAAAIAGGAFLYFHQSVADVRAHTPAVKAAAKRLDVTLPGHAAVALIVGYDKRLGADRTTTAESRSDTIMLVRADPASKTISLLSFPRDLWVQVRCPATRSAPERTFHSRINGAWAACGPQGTLLTVKDLTGLPINYLVTVDFHGFKAIVNKMHGVWMDVDRRYFNNRSGPYGYATINLRPGYQNLSGQQALDFVRYRHTDSDLYRLARQQAFVKAFKQGVAQSVSPLKLPGLIKAITSNVEVGAGGGKALDDKTVLRYALFAYDLPPGHFFQAKLQNIGQNSSFDLLASPSDVESAIQDFVDPDLEGPKRAQAAAQGIRLKTKAPKPSETTVTVLNGNGVDGSAANAAYQLAADHGYVILPPPASLDANAPARQFHTKVYFDPKAKGAQAAAKAMQNLLQPADVAKVPASPGLRKRAPNSMLLVVVGQTFHGEIPKPRAAKIPTRQKAYVRYDASSADSLRAVQRKAKFPLMVPTVLERSSGPDREDFVRVYRVHGKDRAVRMVLRTGAMEYWGVQQTSWADAPVLSDRSFARTMKGKRYDLYYSGTHLHMVVLRHGDDSYWVVNTLLDSLSNETMLAIAKGLKPLTKAK